MRFGKTLRTSVYEPWQDKYIDYSKLKSLLREDKFEDDDQPWTEEDEQKFCDEIFNKQLEKVANFQESKVNELREQIDAAFDKLKYLTPTTEVGADNEEPVASSEIATQSLKDLEAELDGITNEVRELKKYSNLNYTGFLKIVKKHDRKRGNRYKIRPFMQNQLSNRPFNSEQAYSPLLNKLSLMFYAVRQHLEENVGDAPLADVDSLAETRNGERYTAHKFWVHPDNLLEVKTFILRRLPNLVYSASSAKEVDGNEDPSLTSLYFDNSKFNLYLRKVERETEASSLRLRWFGQLSAKPEIFLEQKILHDHGGSEERKFTIKEKYVKAFLDGEYKMEKTIQKMERQGQRIEEVETFKSTVDGIQEFIKESNLQPVLRANYRRTAFQKPADDRVRISIDTELAFVREDTWDSNRPCRDPKEWHRLDIDNRNMGYPFKDINQSEVSKFPYAVLEIKLKEDGNRKRPEWVEDLMSSHLVHAAPRFSKFAHGVAVLFDDYVNILPFWLSDLESDIRKDPQAAFEEVEQKKARRAADEQVVGSFLGNKMSSFQPSKSSPVSKSFLADRMASEVGTPYSSATAGRAPAPTEENGIDATESPRGYGTISSVLPSFTGTRYSKAKRAREAPLPEGVKEPEEWIKNAGPLKIEPKVWLANERTFLKWQHICVLLGGLAISLYTAAGKSMLAEIMGIAYLAIAAFAGLWGYSMQKKRREMIIQRSGKDFDNMIGPMVVSAALMVALVLNFVFEYLAAVDKLDAAEAATSQNKIGQSLVDELLR